MNKTINNINRYREKSQPYKHPKYSKNVDVKNIKTYKKDSRNHCIYDKITCILLEFFILNMIE